MKNEIEKLKAQQDREQEKHRQAVQRQRDWLDREHKVQKARHDAALRKIDPKLVRRKR